MYPKKPVIARITIIVIIGNFVAADEKKFVKSFIKVQVNVKNNLNVFINVKYM